jgi:hypothetical protein
MNFDFSSMLPLTQIRRTPSMMSGKNAIFTTFETTSSLHNIHLASAITQDDTR